MAPEEFALKGEILRCVESDRKINFACELCKYLENNQLSLEQVVVTLGPYLTSNDRAQQLKAIDFLYNLCNQADTKLFKPTEVEFLAEFFIKRLSDTFLIPPQIAQTCLIFVQKWNLTPDTVRNMATSIFKQVEMNQQSTEIRFLFYQVIGKLLQSYLRSLQELRSEFVHGFFQMIEGEKDPRCLLVIFALHRLVTQNFNIDPFAEEMFEVVACYFPISYNPPKEKNTLNITRENLSLSLKLCLQNERKFAPYLLPFLLEKLESPVEQVKQDCYSLLYFACEHYLPTDFAAHYQELWTCIKIDALGNSSQIQIMSSKCIQNIAKNLKSSHNLYRKWIALVRSELEPCLVNPDLNCFFSASTVLAKLSNLDSSIANLLVGHFCIQMEKSEQLSLNRSIELLKSIESFAVESINRSIIDPTPEEENDEQQQTQPEEEEEEEKVDKTFTRLFTVLTLNLHNYSRSEKLFHAYLQCMCACLHPECNLDLNQTELEDFTHKIIALLVMTFDEHPSCQTEKLLLNLFSLFVRKYPRHASFHVYPFVLQRLNCNDFHVMLNVMRAIPYCQFDSAQLNKFYQFATSRLMRRESMFEQLNEMIVATLSNFLDQSDRNVFLFQTFTSEILNEIHRIATGHISCSPDDRPSIYKLLKMVSARLDSSESRKVVTFFTNILLRKSPNESLDQDLIPGDLLVFNPVDFKNYNIFDGSAQQVIFIRLLHSILVDLNFDFDELNCLAQLMDRIFHLLFNSYFIKETNKQLCDQLTREILESLVAKNMHRDTFRGLLNEKLNALYQQSKMANILSKKMTFINIFSSLARAMLHVNHADSGQIFEHLIGLLILSKEAQILIYLVNAFDYILQPANHLQPKSCLPAVGFVEQRFFYAMYPRLLSNYNHLDELFARTRQVYESPRDDPKVQQLFHPEESKQPNLNNVGKIVMSIEKKIKLEQETKVEEEEEEAKDETIEESTSKNKQAGQEITLVRQCLSYIILLPLRYLPKKLIESEMAKLEKIISNVLFGAEIESASTLFFFVQLHCLRLLFELSPNSTLLQNNLMTVITFLTQKLTGCTSARARCQILDCLTLVASNYPEIELLKLRKQVLNNVDELLDDPKRVVRYSAVRTKCKWTLIGQPS